MKTKINYQFIAELEGNSLTGYVPDPDNSNSGVTIGSGFDLGQRSRTDLIGLPKCLIGKLAPYLGKKKREAVEFLKANPLTVTVEECEKINRFAHQEVEELLLDLWEGEAEFNELTAEQQTVVASVSFQYGNLATRTPNFWRQVTSGDWSGALANLRNFGDRYPTRRNKEADYLEGV